MLASLRAALVISIICFLMKEVTPLRLQSPPKLILLQQFMRHGPRYPTDLKGINLDSLKWNGQGQYPRHRGGYLTNKGKRMSYLLGKQMFKQYWKELFGDDLTFRVEKFKVRSLSQNRCIQSGQAHSLGLLQNTHQPLIESQDLPFTIPPFKNSSVSLSQGPVFGEENKRAHILPIQNYTLEGISQIKPSKQNCPRQQIWRFQNIQGQRFQYLYQNPKYKAVVQKVQQQFNVKISGENVLSRYYGQIESLKGLKFSFTPYFYQTSPQYKDYKISSAISLYTSCFGQQIQLNVQMNGIFHPIVNNIKQKLTLKDAYPSWFMYVIHQQQMGGILAILNFTNLDCMLESLQTGEILDDCYAQIPTACSTFIFEFYEYSPSNRITFKIRFNGQYKKIGFCQNQQECDVGTLYSWFETWRVADMQKTCAKP